MKRAWTLLAVVSALAAFGPAALARMPHPPDTTRLEPARPRMALNLTVGNGAVSPAVSVIRKGTRVILVVLNHDDHVIRFTLTGYEERVTAERIAPDSTWRTVFVADRPGDEFDWQVNGHAAGRFIVLGSQLEEGHK